MDEDKANANSEIRYLALELTKLAKKTKTPFEKIAQEYVRNVFTLEQTIIKNVKKYYQEKENIKTNKRKTKI
jgi:hypothetical protein